MILTEPVLAVWIAAALVVAGAMGWMLHALWRWLSMATGSERERIRELIEQAHAAEEAREAAEAARDTAETRLAEREAALTAEIARQTADAAAALAECEDRLGAALREAEGEARTAWDGLSAARRRIAELEREIAEIRQRG